MRKSPGYSNSFFLTKGSGLTKSREKWNDIYNDFANKQKDYEKEKQELMKLL